MNQKLIDEMCAYEYSSALESKPLFQFCLREDLTKLCANTEFTPETFLPTRATPQSTGYDIRCAAPDGIKIKAGCSVKIPLGFRVFSPPGWWLEVRPRSSLFFKSNIHALYGVIDEDYENEVSFLGQYFPNADSLTKDDITIKFGERIAQMIPVPRQDMKLTSISSAQFDLLAETRAGHRKTGGFGSSGKF